MDTDTSIAWLVPQRSALDPVTGKEIWVHQEAQPENPAPGPGGNTFSTRGVGYWPGDKKTAPRILVTMGAKLVALDAKTGKPVKGFGKNGYADMVPSYGRTPTIVGDIAIVGAASLENTKGGYANPRGPSRVQQGASFTVSVDVTNAGERPGKEVVQLYVEQVSPSEARPLRELKGFRKIDLKPGETRTIEVTFPEEYGAKELAGKAATFDITAKRLRKQVVPAADEGLATKIGFETLEELRDVRAHRVEAVCRRPGDVAELALLPGVEDARIDDDRVTCTVHGPVGALLGWLVAHDVQELDSRELSLEEVFLSEFDTESDASR